MNWGGKKNTRILYMLRIGDEQVPIHPPAPQPSPSPPPPPAPTPTPTPTPPAPAPTPTPTPPPTPTADPLPPDPSPTLPSGLFPDDSDTWVRGTIIERSGTRLIRLDTSYSTTAQDFFGSDAETIVQNTITINQNDERFTTSESTKLIAHTNKITFRDSSDETAISTFLQDLTDPTLEAAEIQGIQSARNGLIDGALSKYGLNVGDTIRFNEQEYEIISYDGNAAVVDGDFDAVVVAEFEIDTIVEETIVDPVIEAYTDTRAEFIEILGYPKPDSVYNIQDNDVLVTIDGSHTGDANLLDDRGKVEGDVVAIELLPGDRVDVKFSPPSEGEPPNWLGAYFVNIFDIREVDDTAGY